MLKRSRKLSSNEVPSFPSSPWWLQLKMCFANFLTYPVLDKKVPEDGQRVVGTAAIPLHIRDLGSDLTVLTKDSLAEVGCFCALFGSNEDREAMARLVKAAADNAEKKKNEKEAEAAGSSSKPGTKPALPATEDMSARKQKLWNELLGES